MIMDTNSKTLNERVEILKKNLDIASESSKKAIKEIIQNCTEQAGEAVANNKKMFETIKDTLIANGIDTTIIDNLYDSFNTSLNISGGVIDKIISAHNERIDITVEFQEKFLSEINEQRKSGKVDFDSFIKILQDNFEDSVKLSNNNMKEMVNVYNTHVNLALSFNNKFSNNILSQIELTTDFYKKRSGMYTDWVSNWWKNA